MPENKEGPGVVHNEGKSRFELEGQGASARLDYRLKPESIVFTHTEVPEAMEGRGVGAALARAGLDYARESGMRVDPQCPFIATYIKRHPEYQELVDVEAAEL